ncbi:speckle-type POZ protein-like [Phymastichus coffea]|uniref:speckle-type POZ protein-like n=1 Tax=Phymastichus coffea TaxID=108790 RepID=UPI00273C9E30|nr:speckle-type POZ protein-like [Phymastichus coffea]
MCALPTIIGSVAVNKSVLLWKFENSALPKINKHQFLGSPNLFNDNSRWQFSLLIKEFDGNEYLTLTMKHQVIDGKKELITVVSLLDNQNQSHFSRMVTIPVIQTYVVTLDKFISYNDLIDNLDQFSTDEQLILRFEILLKPNLLISNFRPMNFLSSFNDEKFSDICFVIGDKKLYAHKVILANRSDVFLELFEKKGTESQTNEVNVDDITYEIFQEMLRFIYYGKVNDIENIAEHLLEAASKYALTDLEYITAEYLIDHMTVDNLFQLLELGDRLNVSSLKQKALQFSVMHGEHFLNNPEFTKATDLSKHLMLEIIQTFVMQSSSNIQCMTTMAEMRECPPLFMYTLHHTMVDV